MRVPRTLLPQEALGVLDEAAGHAQPPGCGRHAHVGQVGPPPPGILLHTNTSGNSASV